MPREPEVADQPRTVLVTFRLTPLEARRLDRLRGTRKRGDFVRALINNNNAFHKSEPTE